MGPMIGLATMSREQSMIWDDFDFHALYFQKIIHRFQSNIRRGDPSPQYVSDENQNHTVSSALAPGSE